MAQKAVAKTKVQSVPAGKKVAPRPRKQPRVKISAGTWIFIVVLLASFSVWNFYFLPRMGLTDITPPSASGIPGGSAREPGCRQHPAQGEEDVPDRGHSADPRRDRQDQSLRIDTGFQDTQDGKLVLRT